MTDSGLTVRGLDCLDGTPLLDLKPYFGSSDAKPQADVAWTHDIAFPGRRSADIAKVDDQHNRP